MPRDGSSVRDQNWRLRRALKKVREYALADLPEDTIARLKGIVVLEAAEAALADPALAAPGRIEALRLLGSALVVLERGADAESAFGRIFVIDPDYVLPASTSPRVRAVFEPARARWQVAEPCGAKVKQRAQSSSASMRDRCRRRPRSLDAGGSGPGSELSRSAPASWSVRSSMLGRKTWCFAREVTRPVVPADRRLPRCGNDHDPSRRIDGDVPSCDAHSRDVRAGRLLRQLHLRPVRDLRSGRRRLRWRVRRRNDLSQPDRVSGRWPRLRAPRARELCGSLRVRQQWRAHGRRVCADHGRRRGTSSEDKTPIKQCCGP